MLICLNRRTLQVIPQLRCIFSFSSGTIRSPAAFWSPGSKIRRSHPPPETFGQDSGSRRKPSDPEQGLQVRRSLGSGSAKRSSGGTSKRSSSKTVVEVFRSQAEELIRWAEAQWFPHTSLFIQVPASHPLEIPQPALPRGPQAPVPGKTSTDQATAFLIPGEPCFRQSFNNWALWTGLFLTIL